MDANTITSCLLGGIGALNVFILGLLLYQIRGFRLDLKGIYKALEKKVEKEDYKQEICDLWKHHFGHKHNGDGRVIPLVSGG